MTIIKTLTRRKNYNIWKALKNVRNPFEITNNIGHCKPISIPPDSLIVAKLYKFMFQKENWLICCSYFHLKTVHEMANLRDKWVDFQKILQKIHY